MSLIDFERPTRLMRSMLFVPGTRYDMAGKAAASAADAVCLDLEDAVAPEEKEAARDVVIQALHEIDFGPRRIVRINGLDTPYAYRDLADVVEAAGDRIDLIMLPKANGSEKTSASWRRFSLRLNSMKAGCAPLVSKPDRNRGEIFPN